MEQRGYGAGGPEWVRDRQPGGDAGQVAHRTGSEGRLRRQ